MNFRVESEKWNDQAPKAPKIRKPDEPDPEVSIEYKTPYSIEVLVLTPMYQPRYSLCQGIDERTWIGRAALVVMT